MLLLNFFCTFQRFLALGTCLLSRACNKDEMGWEGEQDWQDDAAAGGACVCSNGNCIISKLYLRRSVPPICRLFPAPTCWPCLRVACGHVCQLLLVLLLLLLRLCFSSCVLQPASRFVPHSPIVIVAEPDPAVLLLLVCAPIFGAFLLIYAKLWHFSIAFYTRPASFATSSGSCWLRAPGLRGPVSFPLVCVVQFSHICATLATEMRNTFAPSHCVCFIRRLEEHLHGSRLPRPPAAAASCGSQLHFIATDASVC